MTCKLLILRISIKSSMLIIAINICIYNLKETGIVVFSALVNHIESFRYYLARFTPCLWKHKTSNLIFTLVADDFGIKFFNNYHVDHIIKAL